LDYFGDSQQLQSILNNSDFDQYSSYCYLDGYTEQDIATFLHHQTTKFTKEQEYGLLNRLDNDTGGFLYFAKNPESYQFYKDQQHK
jgi:23S rRNA-/tRNA-specific pseudouridylate synthase